MGGGLAAFAALASDPTRSCLAPSVPTQPCPASWQPAAALSRLVKHDFAFYTFANLLAQHFSFTCRESVCPGTKGLSVRAPRVRWGIAGPGRLVESAAAQFLTISGPLRPALVHLSIYQCLPHSEAETDKASSGQWGWHWPLFSATQKAGNNNNNTTTTTGPYESRDRAAFGNQPMELPITYAVIEYR